MKKLTIVAAMAIVAAGFTACGNQTPKANLKTDVDSMSYDPGSERVSR
jgi:FKBP-type peptidyl-prolyl cis-trans isomerase FklB